MGEDEEEVEDGDEGEVTLLGLTSTSFFSFRSTCLLLEPEREGKRIISTKSDCIHQNTIKHKIVKEENYR